MVAQNQPSRPDPNTFESGDFIWPKRPDQSIPYFTDPSRDYDYESDKKQWELERSTFLINLSSNPNKQDHLMADTVKNSTFDEFLESYIGDTSGSDSTALLWTLYVGHVAIILRDKQGTWVIEAIPREVRKVSYESWLTDFKEADVWHGRLKAVTADRRTLIVKEAQKQLHKPYSIMSFDLSDERTFYCSKLVWLSIFQALKIAVDDNPDPNRNGWFSPKQLINVPGMDILFKPGEYRFQ